MSTPSESSRSTSRKTREGYVVSASLSKTAVVSVVDRVRHSRYAKTVQRSKKFHAQDDFGDLKVGDRVRIVETRPLSKLKRWRVSEVVERAK
jgi:small subunit ribosomal protein S17